jgi:hypothetical protein
MKRHVASSWIQNFPVLNSAVTGSTGTTITGTLQSAKNATFRVEFFATPMADPSGFGQGKTFLGFATVATNAGGAGNFTFKPTKPVAVGLFVTSTATDAAGDTSEFAQDVKVAAGPLEALSPPAVSVDPLDAATAPFALEGSTLVRSTTPPAMAQMIGVRLTPETGARWALLLGKSIGSLRTLAPSAFTGLIDWVTSWMNWDRLTQERPDAARAVSRGSRPDGHPRVEAPTIEF